LSFLKFFLESNHIFFLRVSTLDVLLDNSIDNETSAQLSTHLSIILFLSKKDLLKKCFDYFFFFFFFFLCYAACWVFAAKNFSVVPNLFVRD
jgi:hypothetical protein